MKDKPDVTMTQKVSTTAETLQAVCKVLEEAPSVAEVLAKPMVYEAWLKKVREALNG